MNKEEFKRHWDLYETNDSLFDSSGNKIADVCPKCGKVEPSSATMNCGTWQPEYCQCD